MQRKEATAFGYWSVAEQQMHGDVNWTVEGGAGITGQQLGLSGPKPPVVAERRTISTFARGPRWPSGARTRPVMPMEGLDTFGGRRRVSRFERRLGVVMGERGGPTVAAVVCCGRAGRSRGGSDSFESGLGAVTAAGGSTARAALDEGEGERYLGCDRAGTAGGSRGRVAGNSSGEEGPRPSVGRDLNRAATRAPGPATADVCEAGGVLLLLLLPCARDSKASHPPLPPAPKLACAGGALLTGGCGST